MASKMVEDRRQKAASLVAFAEVFVREVAPAVEARLSRFRPEGGMKPGVALLAEVVASGVAERAESLVAADQAALERRAELDEARKEERRASAELGDCLSRIRSVSRCLRKRPAWGRLVPEEPRVPRSVEGRLRSADRYLACLRHPHAVSYDAGGVKVDPAMLAASVEERADPLRTAVVEVEERSGEARLAQEAKREAMAAFEAAYGPGRRLLSALAELADAG